jgi:hypothetical protein
MNKQTKTNELTGAALDWAVAKCEGERITWSNDEDAFVFFDREEGGERTYTPSTDWAQGGPLIEREGIALYLYGNGEWNAMTEKEYQGPTPLIAAMRCYVASKLGDTVDIPAELTTEVQA